MGVVRSPTAPASVDHVRISSVVPLTYFRVMTSSAIATYRGTIISQQVIPPLENGNRLTIDEFEHPYSAMPHLKQALLTGDLAKM